MTYARNYGIMNGENDRKCPGAIIAVDFDGTLCKECYPQIGEANKDLISVLQQLQKENCKLVLWTCRCGKLLEEAVQWCFLHGLVFDAVNENVPEILEYYGSDSRKIYADLYIDDKACHLEEGAVGGWHEQIWLWRRRRGYELQDRAI